MDKIELNDVLTQIKEQMLLRKVPVKKAIIGQHMYAMLEAHLAKTKEYKWFVELFNTSTFLRPRVVQFYPPVKGDINRFDLDFKGDDHGARKQRQERAINALT